MGMVIAIGIGACIFYLLLRSAQRSRKRELLRTGRWTEKDLSEMQARQLRKFKARLSGAFGGALLGSFFGIAGLGGAIAGTIPGAILGWYFGGRAAE